MYTQILKEILLEIEYKDESFQDMVSYYENHHELQNSSEESSDRTI